MNYEGGGESLKVMLHGGQITSREGIKLYEDAQD